LQLEQNPIFGKAKPKIRHIKVTSNWSKDIIKLEKVDLPIYMLSNERSLMLSSTLPVKEWVTPAVNLMCK